MIEILPRSHDNVFGIKVGGKLEASDYENVLIPNLDALLAKHKKVSVLVHMDESFTGWSLDAAWDDASYGIKHRAEFERFAVVGAPAWVRWSMAASAFLMPGEMRAFSADELEKAWDWVGASAKKAA